jgi:hypothetical protein
MSTTTKNCTHKYTYSVWTEDSLDGYYRIICKNCHMFLYSEC